MIFLIKKQKKSQYFFVMSDSYCFNLIKNSTQEIKQLKYNIKFLPKMILKIIYVLSLDNLNI